MTSRGCNVAFLQFLSAIGFLLGIGYFISATSTPGSYRLYEASAIQASQVYTMALYYAVLSVSCFLFGIFLQVVLYFGNYYNNPKLESIEEEAVGIRVTLNKVGRVLQQQASGQPNPVSSTRQPVASKTAMQALLDRDEPEF